MDFMGVDMKRITFSWVSAAEGAKWADVVNTTIQCVKELGPYISYKELVNSSVEEEVKNG
jgi:coenzyme F420-reducing hydrogenase delta subunit